MNEPAPPHTAASEHQQVLVAALKAFFATWRAAGVYDENNRGYQKRRSEMMAALEPVFAEDGEFAIVFQNDYFFVNGARLNYAQVFTIGRSLAKKFTELGLGALRLLPEAFPDHIDRAIFALAQADRKVTDPYGALSNTWLSMGIVGVEVSPVALHATIDPEDGEGNSALDPTVIRRRRARALFGRTESVLRDFWERVRDRNSFEASPVQRVVHQLIDEVTGEETTLLEFAALKDFDEYTFYHSVNVAIYSIAVGMRLGLERTTLAHLGFAALMHDIGKVKLPQDLITKPTEFNESDWEQIRRHPILGALTIAQMRALDAEVGTAIATAFEHHLKMDLSGYPAVTRARDLHLFSRIVAVCDVFDAMTSGRVYQKVAIPPDEAVRKLLYKGREWYDPIVLKAFVNVLGIFPVGTLVKLSDNSLAVVVRNDNEDLYSPVVHVIRDPDGREIRREVSLKIDDEDPPPPEDRLYIMDLLEPHKLGINIYEYIGQVEQTAETSAHDARVEV